jgi:CRP-like cAMP-binding protein
MPDAFIAHLEFYGSLTEEERSFALDLLGPRRSIEQGADLIVEGEAASECQVLLEGQVFRHKTLADGRRQIFSFHVPGDVVGLEAMLLGRDCTVSALTACQVAPIARARFDQMAAQHPRLAMLTWRLSLAEIALLRERLTGLGRRSAYGRMAHLLCEVFARQTRAGLARQNRCHFPVTQAHLADALGLSGVHTNRVLQELRQKGLIELRGRELVILNWPGLQAAGEFEEPHRDAPDPLQ